MKICKAVLCEIPFKVSGCANGGSFDCLTREIEIGLNGTWAYTTSILLHEAFECAMAMHHVRFTDPGFHESSDSYMFMMNHHAFSNICQDVAVFVAVVTPKLEKAYREYNK